MSTLLLWQRLAAEKASLEQFLSTKSPSDILGRMSIESRLAELSQEMERFGSEPKTKAEIALVLHGKPVTGSQAIQASFGTKVIEAFQKSVSTAYAQQTGDVAERGPPKARDLSSLHITGVVHGSFGFVLEELAPEGVQMFDSSLKTATDSVLLVLDQISSEDESVAEQAINDISERLFTNIKELVSVLHDSEASMNLIGPERETPLEGPRLERAYQRTADAKINDEEVLMTGILQGLLPTKRRFEFKVGTEIINGSVAKDISEEYLSTLETKPMTGHPIVVKFKKRTLLDKLGNERHYFTLIEVVDDGAGGSHPLIARP